MKSFGVILILVAVFLIGFSIFGAVRMSYQWDNQFASPWNLADKSSTLSQKAEYIDKFVSNLKAGIDANDHDALYFKTPNNSCGENIKAVESLASRLHELQKADPESMAYQQAIQQITAQEQGEASEMITTLQGCWQKHAHPWYWNPWLGLLYVTIVFGVISAGGVIIAAFE
jgi:predicted negative regulator of RcsB-dependent stress response